jgi:hypothetical protein
MSKDMNNLKPVANVEAAAYASLTRAYCHESEPILRANPSLLKDDSVRTIAGQIKATSVKLTFHQLGQSGCSTSKGPDCRTCSMVRTSEAQALYYG